MTGVGPPKRAISSSICIFNHTPSFDYIVIAGVLRGTLLRGSPIFLHHERTHRKGGIPDKKCFTPLRLIVILICFLKNAAWYNNWWTPDII
jgi:hypothetical protein